MADRFAGMGDDLLGPATRAVAVTPSDTADLAYASKRLWVGGAGNLKVDTVGGDTVVYTAVPAGTYILVRATRVYATPGGSAASDIVAEY